MEENKMEKEISPYEKAIEGRFQHMSQFNYWMNMFAIFNGALFVGYYNVVKECACEKVNPCCATFILTSVILLLGVVSSWLWYFSARGFYRWNISWINIVKNFEKNELGNNHVYRAFAYPKDLENRKFVTKPFSSQKLAKSFVLCVAIAWTLIAIFNLVKIFAGCSDQIGNVMKCIIAVIFGVAVIFLICVAVRIGRESDLEDSHYVYKASGKDNLELVK